jgi:hypothetical protein
MTSSTDRHTFREVVAQVAEKARAKLPQNVNGRIESAVRLVLMHDVMPQADGSILVGSSRDPLQSYLLVGTACECQDFTRGQAPDGWCQHPWSLTSWSPGRTTTSSPRLRSPRWSLSPRRAPCPKHRPRSTSGWCSLAARCSGRSETMMKPGWRRGWRRCWRATPSPSPRCRPPARRPAGVRSMAYRCRGMRARRAARAGTVTAPLRVSGVKASNPRQGERAILPRMAFLCGPRGENVIR